MSARTLLFLAGILAAVLGLGRPATAAELIFNTQEFAPFNYGVNGVASGPVPDIVRKICADMRIDCPMRVLPWRRAQQEHGRQQLIS